VHCAFCALQTPEVKQGLHAGPFPPGPHCAVQAATAHWLLISRLMAFAGVIAAQQAQEQAGPAFCTPQAYSV
jgi:hypothetical protein